LLKNARISKIMYYPKNINYGTNFAYIIIEILKYIIMKKIFLLILAVPFFFTGCRIEPYANFHVSKVIVDVGEVIYFTNTSFDASYFEWDFGDGTISYILDPVHVYSATGTYTVTLTAISRDDIIDRSFQTITVLFPTILELTVLEYYDEYPVANASILLYPSYDDWLDETNYLPEGFTNQNGNVIFSNLEAIRYYVDVWEANHDNYTLADEDIGFIKTHRLYKNEINYFTAWVDYYPDKKSSRNKSIIIRKLDRRSVEDKK